MRRARWLVVLALAWVAGCGKPASAPEPSWSESPPGAARPSPAAGPSISTSDEPRILEEAIGRAQQRLQQAPELIGLMNPLGGKADIPEAARRTTAVIKECRADQAVVARIADQLADAWPDPARAPSPAVLRLTRASAYRFREWALLQLLLATDRTAKDLLAGSSSPSTASILLAAAQLDGLKYTHEGAILLRRYLAVAPEALRRAARPAEKLEDVATLLADTRMMSTAWGPSQWPDGEAGEVNRWIEAYRAAAGALPAPAGPIIARLVNRWWDWGKQGTGTPMEPADLAASTADLRALAPLLPASTAALEALAAELER